MHQNTVVYPGSFDPITLGHVDIIHRSSKLFDHVVVALYAGPEVRYQWPQTKRLAMAKSACASWDNVTICTFEGLLVNWMQQEGYVCIIRGIRDGDDMSQEWRMAHSNQVLLSEIETLFLPASPGVSYISSTLVRQILAAGGDPSPFIPSEVLLMMKGDG